MNPKQHSVRIAALRVLGDEVKTAQGISRGEAEKVFAAARNDLGMKAVDVTLNDGTPLGSVAIKAGAKTVTVKEPVLLALVAESKPGEIVEELKPGAEADPELLEWVKANRPGLLQRKVRDSYRAKVIKGVNANGEVVNTATGELVKVAEVSHELPTGAFAYTPCAGAAEAIMRAWQRGELVDVLGDVLRPAVEAAPDGAA